MSENNRIRDQVFFYAGLLLAWQAIVSLKLFPEYLIPGPLKVVMTLWDGFTRQSFFLAILVSFKRLLIGFGGAVLISAFLGVILLKFRRLESTLGGLILGLQTLPSICWFPLAIIWFGLSEWAIIFVVFMGSVFSLAISIDFGFKGVSPLYIAVGRNMGATRFRLLRSVIVPAAAPALFLGMKQGWSFAWRSLMAGELLYNSMGLGFILNTGRELNDMSQVLAVIGIIAFLSIAIDKLIFCSIETAIKERYGLKRRG